jgi:hypothetical protein
VEFSNVNKVKPDPSLRSFVLIRRKDFYYRADFAPFEIALRQVFGQRDLSSRLIFFDITFPLQDVTSGQTRGGLSKPIQPLRTVAVPAVVVISKSNV